MRLKLGRPDKRMQGCAIVPEAYRLSRTLRFLDICLAAAMVSDGTIKALQRALVDLCTRGVA